MKLSHSQQELVGQWLQEAYSEDLHRDVHLICHGGTTVAWSKLLLVQWSPVLKRALTESNPYADSVVFLPDFEVGTVEKMLVLSTAGEVAVNEEEKVGLTDLLRMLGRDTGRDQSLSIKKLTEVRGSEQPWEESPLGSQQELVEADYMAVANEDSTIFVDSMVTSIPSSVADATDTSKDPLEAPTARESSKLKPKDAGIKEACIMILVNGDDTNTTSVDSTATSTPDSVADATDMSDSPLESPRTSSEEEDPEAVWKIAQEFKIGTSTYRCVFCPAIQESFSDTLCHLSREHFRDNIIRAFPPAVLQRPGVGLTTLFACPICGDFRSVSRSAMVSHVGGTHQKVLRFLPDPDVLPEGASKALPGLRCLLCPKSFVLKTRLLCHLSRSHFRSNIEKDYLGSCEIPGREENRGCYHCTFCKKRVVGRSAFVVHVGCHHRKVLRYLPERYRRHVDLTKTGWLPTPESDGATGEPPSSTLASSPTSSPPGCVTRTEGQEGSTRTAATCPVCHREIRGTCLFKRHLAETHFYEAVRDLLGKGRKCPVCRNVFASEEKKVIHYASTHNMILDFVPDHLRAMLENMGVARPQGLCPAPGLRPDCSPPTSGWPLATSEARRSSPTRMSPSGCGRSPAMTAPGTGTQKPASSDPRAGGKGTIVCPVCHQGRRNLSSFKQHLAISHFSSEIRRRLDRGLECPLCDHVSGNRQNMVVHYGARHNMILDFVPDELRTMLGNMGVRKRETLDA